MGLIEVLGGEVEKMRFQKLLFLYAQRKSQPEYDFVPYKFGCYSYSAKADMNTMVNKGILTESENRYEKKDSRLYCQQLKESDRNLLAAIVEDYGNMNSTALIKHTYINFPFYAIQSIIAHEVLTDRLYEKVEQSEPRDNDPALFTIGYEGISLEKYLEKLLRNNVKLLVDVRRNPLSMKFGFSKSPLKRFCNSLGIEYQHIPEVGIASSQRQQLESQADYDQLFSVYCKTTLKETSLEQVNILRLLQNHNRIALTCFEAEPCQCHRTHLAHSISKLPGFDYPLIHL